MPIAEIDGFTDLFAELEAYGDKVSSEKVVQILEVGADAFVQDALKLPKPKSKITATGYTHLVDSFTRQTKGQEVKVGWGKYYGRMVELGTKRNRAQPHLLPLYERNASKYDAIMREAFEK